MITFVSVRDRTQSMGDVVIDSFPSEAEWLQVDAECQPGGSGKLFIKFKTPGMRKEKNLIDEAGELVYIDLASPYPLRIQRLSISSLVISPEVSADSEFSISAAWDEY